MGEKTGGLTNMVLVIVALIAILLVVQVAFPNLTTTVTDGMEDVVDQSIGSYQVEYPD